MIVKLLLSLCKSFIANLPVLDLDFGYLIAMQEFAFDLIVDGVSLLGVFIGGKGLQAIFIYFGVLLAINAFYIAYQLVWFFLKKLPMLNIRQ